MSLVFDSTKHEYRMDGRSVPSVTKILSVVQDFSAIPPEQLRIASEWGSAVHEYLRLYDAGELDLKKADPRMLPIIDSWERLKVARGWVDPVISEQPFYSKRYGYAGTPDRLFKAGSKYTLLDIKTGEGNFANMQTAAYLQLIKEDYANLNQVERMKVHLDFDGKMKSEIYQNFKADFNDFLCCARVFKLKKK